MKTGEKLKFIRKQKRLTLQDVATGSGASKSSLCELEHHVNTPNVKQLLKIAKFYKISLSILLKGVDE